MTEATKTKRAPIKNRVSLSDASFERLQNWEAQVQEQCKGTNIKATHLIEMLILAHTQTLSQAECLDLEEKHSDDIALASWVLRELKKSRAAGEKRSIQDILGQEKMLLKTRTTRPRRKMANEKTSGQLDGTGASQADAPLPQ